MKMKSGIQSIGYSVLAGLTAMTMASSANAAKISLTTSYEVGDYGSDYNYDGPRLDMTINPDGTNWYFDIGTRKRNHDNGQRYSRTDLSAGYRFRFENGWIQPEAKIRRDETLYKSSNGGRLMTDIYGLELNHILSLGGNWGLWGDWSFQMMKETSESVKSGALESIYSDAYTWEIEEGIRYYFSNDSRITVSLYDFGRLADKGSDWGVGGSNWSSQARAYYYHKFANGLSIQPYVRYPLSWGERQQWYVSPSMPEGSDQLSKVTRYAFQFTYPVTTAMRLVGEYYLEDIKYKEGFSTGKDDSKTKYFKLGLNFNF